MMVLTTHKYMNNFDLVIIGGGAAGIMSAISAKRSNPELSVCIIDRTFALGRKILVCGAGRCNITNIHLNEEVDSRYYGASKPFISSIFSQFGYIDIVHFFSELGVELYTERKTDIGKVFPVTDQAKTITAVLENELKILDIKVFLNTEVTSIEKGELFNIKTRAVELTDRQKKEYGEIGDNTPKEFTSKYLILSAGGKTYPALGSNGSGYDLAMKFGHKIVEVVPSALPLVLSKNIFKGISGLKMDIEATSIIGGEEIKKSSDDVMFTDYGLSGPAILNISREISIELNRSNSNKRKCEVKLNFFPGKSIEEVKNILNDRWLRRPNLTLSKSLIGIFPNRICEFLGTYIGYGDEIVNDLSVTQKEKIFSVLTSLHVEVSETRSWNEAEFTAGGIDINDVKEQTLESKLIPGLYLAGEILDVDGDVGGFNLSWAWASGYVAGKLK